MTEHSELKTEHKVASDPSKTETLITGGEPFKQRNTIDMRLNVKTEAYSEDNSKTLVSLSKPEAGFIVKVIGPFNGSVEVLPGTELRVALAQLNTEDNTFGKYKYRDEEGAPVSIMNTVESSMVLTSVEKG